MYHYASYERTVLQRLAGRYDTRHTEVDRILRGQVLVDLYQVVRHSVLVSQEGYGLKKLEPLYLPSRAGEAITDGGSSIVTYEAWLESGDPQLLEDIRAYNEIDCRSTLGLRDWLEERRDELAERTGAPVPRPAPADGTASAAITEADEEHSAAVAALLLAGVPAREAARSADDDARQLLADLLGWHRREERPGWWAWYERLAMTDEELFSDREAIAGLVPVAPLDGAEPGLHRYRFDPEQEHTLPEGKQVADPRTGRSAGRLVELDVAGGTLVPRPLDPRTCTPPVGAGAAGGRSTAGRCARRCWRWPGTSPCTASRARARGGRHEACSCASPPRRRPGLDGALRAPGEDVGSALVRLVAELDGSCLPVQGPPGSGKTRNGADAVVALVAAGRRVGITAHSHAAITNLLAAVCERAERSAKVRAIQKCDADQVCASADVVLATSNGQVVDALAGGDVDVVAGTAWLFAREDMRASLDVLVVDEAGQLSLANTLAVSGAATDLVLLGDPQQLAQPSKGTHPDGAGVSALDHVLAGAVTIGAERGLFLDRSFRMQPDICRFVSTVSYDGRLEPAPGCERRSVADGPGVGGAGLRWVPVEHTGNRTRCPEEARVVADLATALLGREVTDDRGATSRLRAEDILVIAPYNAQVAALADVLPAGVPVGTVDRFQGQQAAVVLYSLTASSAAEIPRGIGFLLSTHRLNVAVSRAQALVAVVGSPGLLRAPVRTAAELRQVNALCRFIEEATEVRLPSPGGLSLRRRTQPPRPGCAGRRPRGRARPGPCRARSRRRGRWRRRLLPPATVDGLIPPSTSMSTSTPSASITAASSATLASMVAR